MPGVAIPDTALGLPPGELVILRQHHSLALGAAAARAQAAPASQYSYSSASTRGRGQQRTSNASSRAASAASSGGQAGGRLMLDVSSLTVLGAYFDRLMARIQQRVELLSAQTTAAATAQSRSAASTLANADAEIAKFRDILRQIDELETEFDKVRHIRDIVKGFRARVERLSGQMRR